MGDRAYATCDNCDELIEPKELDRSHIAKMTHEEIVLQKSCPNCLTPNILTYPYGGSEINS